MTLFYSLKKIEYRTVFLLKYIIRNKWIKKKNTTLKYLFSLIKLNLRLASDKSFAKTFTFMTIATYVLKI